MSVDLIGVYKSKELTIRSILKEEIIRYILNRPQKSAGRGLILGSTSNLSHGAQSMYLFRISLIFNVKFLK